MNEMVSQVREETRGTGIASEKLPNSIVIAQAILESGNGKSKAARVKNNHFGLSLKSGLMSFTQSIQSVFSYFHTLNNNLSYKKLRSLLLREEEELDVEMIVGAISKPYAKDKGYQQKILNVIETCELARFDI